MSFSLSDFESAEIDDAVEWLRKEHGRRYSRSEVVSAALTMFFAWQTLVGGRRIPTPKAAKRIKVVLRRRGLEREPNSYGHLFPMKGPTADEHEALLADPELPWK